jgi:hypothetical protein
LSGSRKLATLKQPPAEYSQDLLKIEARQQWLRVSTKDFLSAKMVASRLTPATALSSTDLMGDFGKRLFEPN